MQPHEVTAAVSACAIAASFATTWLSLRHARIRSQSERLWLRQAEAYESYVDCLVFLEKQRHDYMMLPEMGHVFDNDPEDPDGMIAALNRLMVYASPVIREVATKADETETAWRDAWLNWHYTKDETSREHHRSAVEAWEMADAISALAIKVIKEELLTGKIPKKRWFKTLKYEPDKTGRYPKFPSAWADGVSGPETKDGD